ncbi:MAG: aldose epimerase family protein [Bacteroidales bacterium]|nr:aldose epimerase family protein [Bacteroidales bacterium]
MVRDNFSKENISGLDPKKFQKNVDGKETELFVLKNKNGMEICTSNYGAIVMSIMTPDKNGKYANVVLGHDSIDNLIKSPEPYLGSTVGRYGNRIAKGKFTLDGKEYTLAINNGPNSLHGGLKGFNKVVWDAYQKDAATVEFKYTSVDGEEGFPGNLSIVMTYTLTDDNEFKIDYLAQTDAPTLVNLTNHAFFNLAGIKNPSPSVENNIVTINADFYTPIDEVSIPTGEIRYVEGTPMDFRTPHVVGERINSKDDQIVFGAGYDHCYVLNKKEPGELSFAAECVEPESGRKLEVYTTEPGVQIYTGNWLNGFDGAHGATFPARSAICFEAQKFPDTPNKPHFPSCELRAGEKYTQTTIYKFGLK